MISNDDIEGFREPENPKGAKELFRYEQHSGLLGDDANSPEMVMTIRKFAVYPGFVQIQIRDTRDAETISMLVPQHVIDELKKVI